MLYTDTERIYNNNNNAFCSWCSISDYYLYYEKKTPKSKIKIQKVVKVLNQIKNNFAWWVIWK